MLKPIKNILEKLRKAILGEIEIVKLRALRSFSRIMGDIFSLLFLLIFMNTTIVLSGLWLGFYLSEIMNSKAWGFGIAAGAFIVLLLIFSLFRKALLVRPAQNMVIRYFHSISDSEQTAGLTKSQNHSHEKSS